MVGREMWKYSAEPVPHVISISGEQSRDMEGCRICEWVPHWRGFMSISLVHFQGHKSQASLTSALVSATVKHASLGPSESITKMASRSVQPFLHSSRRSVVGDVWACPSPSKLPTSYGRSEPPSNTWFFVSTRLSIRIGISIGSAVYAHLKADSPYILHRASFPQNCLFSRETWTHLI